MSEEQVGKILDGKYEVLKQLGIGGMGVLYLVRHLHLDQERVVKILRKDLATDEAARRRFMREAKLATNIKHPNVATLYDFARLPDESFYMVWEYIDGLEIGQLLEQDGPLPLDKALRLAVQALRGLESIHSQGIIHRDVSPDNLMVTRDHRDRPVLKIIDLGLAKDLAPESSVDVTQAGMFLGKLRYCSPEQAEMEEELQLDARSDLYSFALVLYEMICGLPPFESDSTAGFIFKRLSEDPLPLVGRNPEVTVPPALGRVLAKALQRDRTLRYSTGIHFIEALEPILTGLGHAATQRIDVPPELIEKSSAPLGARSPAPKEASIPALSAPMVRRSSQITRKERSELLAQIDRAARRVRETSKLFDQAEEALGSGDLDLARELHGRLTKVNPRAAGLAQLTERLKKAEQATLPAEPVPVEESPEPDLKSRVKAAEALLDGYLRQRKKALAELALSSLLEIAPNHPRKKDYQGWVRLVGKEATQRSKAQVAVDTGRDALRSGDFKIARKQADVARKNDPTGDIAHLLLDEIELAEQERSAGQELEARKEQFEEALQDGHLKEATEALEAMRDLGLTRVAEVFFRSRLETAHAAKQDEATLLSYHERVQRLLAKHDFDGARSLAVTLGQALPENPAPKTMLAEVNRKEEDHRRQKSIEEGEMRVEEFLDSDNPDGAALALKILVQMDPANPRWQQLEKRIQAHRA